MADWFDRINQQLDELRADCLAVEDRTLVPPDVRFDQAKAFVEGLRKIADFPNLPEPDVWPGVNGEIGITLEFPNETLELVVGHKIVARVSDESSEANLELSTLPQVLTRLANQTAA